MVALFVGMCLVWVACVAGVIYALAPRGADVGLYAAGSVMMFAFPLGGFVAGAVLLPRRPSHGAAIMAVSAACAFIYSAALLAL